MKRLIILFISLFIGLPTVSAAAPPTEIARLRAVADSLHSIGRTDSAIVVGRRAIQLAERSGNALHILGTHAAQGVFLRSSGQVDEALKHYNQALRIATSEEVRKKPGQEAVEEIATLYTNLAVLELDMAHREKAAGHARAAAQWVGKCNDAALKSQIYGVVGSVLTGAGDLQGAMDCHSQAYRYALEANDTEAAFRSAAYALLTTHRLHRTAEVTRWRNICVKLQPEITTLTAQMLYYQVECSLALDNQDEQRAVSYFQKILSLKGIEAFPFVQYDCYNNMHLALARLGNYPEAYRTLLKANTVRDTIYEKEKMESLRELSVKYETKEAELALAQSQARQSKTLSLLLAVATSFLVGVIAFMIYYFRQRRRRMQKEMEFARLRAEVGRQLTQQYVDGLESERKRMARELHDGVCNDLLAIEMSMQANNPARRAQTQKLVSECRESVRRISHELMPPEFAYANLDEVVRYHLTKQAEAYAGKIQLNYTSSAEADNWNRVPDHVSLEIYRIVQEATGNALRHSYADTVNVSMHLASQCIQVSIADNGTSALAMQKGVGLKSMKQRANAIGATLRIESPEAGGTQVFMEAKL